LFPYSSPFSIIQKVNLGNLCSCTIWPEACSCQGRSLAQNLAQVDFFYNLLKMFLSFCLKTN
ncbi:hypothetical protein KFY46_26265, partial [Salmonella enterica subsp. enterica serovar 1,4,[5],12:i:-]|nr:hypothetical protein [Salmonella enterica subsp. enterica serovar 1,4,[5],12:i:-]